MVHRFAVKCVRKFKSALGGEVTCECVCVCVCFDTMCQGRTLCMYSPYQERTSNQEQIHSMSVIGFGIRFGLIILENPGINHKIMGVAWVCPLALKLFFISYYTWMKARSWSKPHTFQSALRMLSADHLNIDGRPFPVKCVRKFWSAFV